VHDPGKILTDLVLTLELLGDVAVVRSQLQAMFSS
jgi:hypothetical protein